MDEAGSQRRCGLPLGTGKRAVGATIAEREPRWSGRYLAYREKMAARRQQELRHQPLRLMGIREVLARDGLTRGTRRYGVKI